MTDARLDDDESEHPVPVRDDAAAVRAHADRLRSQRARVVELVGLVLGTLLIGALFVQYLDVYLTFSGDPVTATRDEGARYVVTAVACVALLLAGTAAAVVGEHGGVTALGCLLLAVGLGAAVVLAVPQDRWSYDEAPQGPGPDYHPCYSGGDSDECLGG
jgi:hypothetical protein